MNGDQRTPARPFLRSLVHLSYSLAVLLLLAPLLADLFLDHFSNIGVRTGHGIFVLASSIVTMLGKFLTSAEGNVATARVLAVPILLAGVLTLYARRLDPQPGSPPHKAQRFAALPWLVLIGVPALFTTLFIVIYGVALDPYLSAILWIAAVSGSLLGRRRRRPPMAFERSLSGLPAASWNTDHLLRFVILLTPMMAFCFVVALAGSEQGAARALSYLERTTGGKPDLIGLYAALIILTGVIVAGPTRRALSLMVWEPPVAALVGGLLLFIGAFSAYGGSLAIPTLGACTAMAGCALGGAGAATVPLLPPHPLRAAFQLVLPMLAVVSSSLVVLGNGLLDCGSVRTDPRIEVVMAHPGAKALEPNEGVHPSLFVSFPHEGLVTRNSFKGGTDRGVDLAKLPGDILDSSLDGVTLRSQFLAAVGPDEVLVLATGSSEQLSQGEDSQPSFSNGVLIAIDSLTALPIDTAVTTDECTPTTLAWHPFHSLAVVGCGGRPEIAMYEPTLHRFIAQQSIPSVPEVDSLLIDPADGTLLLLPRTAGAFLVRYDLTSSTTLSWRFVGGGNHDLSQDIDGALYLPRFFSRHVLVLEGEGLNITKTLPGPLGMHMARPVLGTDTLLTASPLTGRIYALDMLGERPAQSLRLGGFIQDLRVSPDGTRAFSAGMCGVLSIDLKAWLDGAAL